MKLSREDVGSVAVVAVASDTVEAANADEFQKQAKELLHDCPNTVLDLTHVEFVDSVGCSAILTCHRRMSAGGADMKVCCLTKPVRAIFQMIRVHRVVEIHNDREEALRAFSASS